MQFFNFAIFNHNPIPSLSSNFQTSLPEGGTSLLPKALSSQKLADKFHDHVVARVKEDWHYWDGHTIQCTM